MFRPEPIAVAVVRRERLLARISGVDARRITVVVAPVGYGKTVLLTHAYQDFCAQGRRCIWLSAGKLSGTGLAARASLVDLLRAGIDHAQLPAAPADVTTIDGLLDHIDSCAEPVAVIINGLDAKVLHDTEALLRHLIEGASVDTSFLIATEAALPLSLVRLEASGLLRTIGAGDLALDGADIAALGAITDLPDWAATLNDQVEGWPAVVQLALSRFREAPGHALPLLTGHQHDIAAFLKYDVLRNVHPDDFPRLLDASVGDQICGSLLDALSDDTAGSALLGRFVAQGVPMTELRNRKWFRLHPLVRDYLYDLLQQHDPGRLQSLHQRAATWLLAAGDEREALRHGTASGDIDFLRSLYPCANIAQAIQADHDQTDPGDDDALRATINAASQPKWRAIFELVETGQIELARSALAQARRQARQTGIADQAEVRPADWELIYIDLLVRVFDDRLPVPDQLEDLRDRLMRRPGVPPAIPAAVSELLIVSKFRNGDLSGMGTAHDLWYTSALAPTQSKIYALLELGIAALELGDVDLATRHLTNARTRALAAYGPNGRHVHAATTLLAEVAYERGDLALCQQLLNTSFVRLKPEDMWFNLVASAMTTGTALAAQRSWDEACAALELSASLSDRSGMWRLPPLRIAQRLRLTVICGQDLEGARKDRAALNGLGLLDPGELDSAGFGWRVAVPTQLAVIRFDIADGKAHAALARCAGLRAVLEARGYVRRLIELDLLQGRALIETGDRSGGVALIRVALRLSVDTGMVQGFVDEARFLGQGLADLLLADDLSMTERAFLDRWMVPVASLATYYVNNGRTFDLSGRENQLLRAMMSGKTFKEISHALNISINTTKMHRTRLYRKLGCNSRSHAIALAQEIIAR